STQASASVSRWNASGNDISNANSGNVGIGTPTPATKLDVAGMVKMSGLQLTAAPGAGRLLTSDATGVGSWQSLPSVASGAPSQALPPQLLPLTPPHPALLSVAGSTTTGSGPQSVAISGDYAYVCCGSVNRMQIFNITDPSNPSMVGSVVTAAGPLS